MKIALIRRQYTDFGGAELYVNGLARRLVERGHEVHILARDWNTASTEGLVFLRVRSKGGEDGSAAGASSTCGTSTYACSPAPAGGGSETQATRLSVPRMCP